MFIKSVWVVLLVAAAFACDIWAVPLVPSEGANKRVADIQDPDLEGPRIMKRYIGRPRIQHFYGEDTVEWWALFLGFGGM